jgi:hypothetical protein
MNDLDERGVIGEGLQRGRLIGSDGHGHRVLLHIQIWDSEPDQCVFEVSPDPFTRMQLWIIRR